MSRARFSDGVVPAGESLGAEHLMRRRGHPSFHMTNRSVIAVIPPSTLIVSYGEHGIR